MNIPRFIQPATILGFVLVIGITFAVSRWTASLPLNIDPVGTQKFASAALDSTPFQRALCRGDKYFGNKDYLNAKASYQVAIDLIPGDTLAKSKLRRTMDLLRSQKAQNILYDVAIASADKLFQEKDFERAKLEYENAGKLMPSESYPKQKINEIIKIQVDKQVLEEKYTQALTQADAFYHDSNFRAALPEYLIAAKLKPEQKYLAERVSELTAIVKALKAKDDAYNKAVSQADQLFKTGQYDGAKKAYGEAAIIQPEQVYPRTKISEIDALIARQKQLRDDYERYIEMGDSLYIAKNYLKARENYKLSLSVKPNEAYPREMVQKSEGLLTGQEAAMAKALDEQYAAAIVSGDRLFNSKSYEQARTEFQKASGLKPQEQYPKDKIEEISKFIGVEKATEDSYRTSIASADKLLTQKRYDLARTEYQKASALKPGEKYPFEQISKIEGIYNDIEAAKRKEELNYKSIITKGDSLLTLNLFEAARVEYQMALKLNPSDAYPKQKLADISMTLEIQSKQKILENQYKSLIAKADNFYTGKQYQLSRVSYEQALKLKPGEPYPAGKIHELDSIFSDIARQKEDELLTKKSLDEQFSQVIVNGDKLFSEKNYDQARAEFQHALDLKPAEAYPKTKMAEIDKMIAEIARLKALEEKYNQFVETADKLLADKSYALAKLQYQAALKSKPLEAYPQSRIREIDIALQDIQKQKALDDQYSAALQKADQLFAEKSFILARKEYQDAGTIKPNEQYPKEKIAETDKFLEEIAARKALDEKYKSILSIADKFFLDQTYELARTEYQHALDLKPEEQYPKDKIASINKIEADNAAKKSLDEQFSQVIVNADKLFSEKKYDQAREEFQHALDLKPAEAYPKTKMAETDKMIAEIARLKALEEQYNQFVETADKLLADKSYALAKLQYQAALKSKPLEAYPQSRIREIDIALQDIQKQKALDDQYSAALQKADQLFAEKSFILARTAYQEAGAIKPNEQYSKDRIVESEKIIAEIAAQKVLDDKYIAFLDNADKLILAKIYEQARREYMNAGNLKPAEQYPKDKIAEIDQITGEIAAKKALDEQYAKVIANADKLLVEKNYDQARAGYQNALTLKPEEAYPKNRITEIDQALSEIVKKQAVDDEFRLLIMAADKLLAGKSLDLAKTEYQKAVDLKPGETYPKTKITEIDNEIAAALTRQKVLDQQYQAALARADKSMVDKSFEQAKLDYTNAAKIKPEEQYPKDRILELEGIISNIKAKEEAYKATVTKADGLMLAKKYEEARSEYENASVIKPESAYPTQKMAEINKILEEILGKRKLFENLLTGGDTFLNEKDYAKALASYKQAAGIFPEESAPKEKTAYVNAKIDSIYRANKGKYDKVVSDGDRYFNAYEYDKAIDAYNEAIAYLPMENYPREMVSKIRKIISENAIVDVFKSTVVIAAGEEKQFPFTPVNMASRKNNFIYIKVKNLSNKSFNVLLRYGKDKQAGGGVVVKNLSTDGRVNERLISVMDQDSWYRLDNNWISLYPQGGDIEVTFIQVSRSR